MLTVSPLHQLLGGKLQVAPAQSPHLLVPYSGRSPYLPGLTPANQYDPLDGYPAHDYTSPQGVPMHMPAYSGKGATPTPLARPLQMPQFPSFNKLRSL